MWLYTTIGFFSVVAHREDGQTLLIRARTREDLDELRRRHLPDLEIQDSADGDYPHCALLERSEWEYALARLAADVDYLSFEDAIRGSQGEDRANLYQRVWDAVRDLV